ncbi:MAG: hypothetical protein U9Q82_04840 [Chloroflexota bacterium]|nr:hypothetical protein [Chloroflexota bacterium]
MEKRVEFADIVEKIPVVLMLLFTGIATWDIVKAVSPPLFWEWLRPAVAVILFDGGFIYWEWRSNDRANTTGQLWTARMMQAAAMIFIALAGVGDALHRQDFVQGVGISQDFAGFLVAAPTIITFVFLIGHTVYVWMDPVTQAKLTRRAANEQIEQATLAKQRQAAERLAPMAGQALAKSRLEADIRKNTGRDIRDLIPDWMERGFDNRNPQAMPVPDAEGGNHRPKVKENIN